MKRFQRAYLEITNQCNLHCSFCPGTKRQGMFLSGQQFEERIAQVSPLAEQVFLHVLGEPLLHPELPLFLRICQQYQLPVNICTNGFLLTPERENILFNPIVRQVNFSLQALMECGHPDQAQEVFRKILKFCQRAIEVRPELYINLRTWDFSGDFKESRLKDTLMSQLTGVFSPDHPVAAFSKGRKSHRLKGRIYWHSDSLFQWPGSGGSSETEQQNPDLSLEFQTLPEGFCHGLTSQFAILCGGEVVPCCLDAEGSILLGNINQTPLERILQSPAATVIQEAFRQNRVWHPFCQNCSFRKRFDRPR